MRKPLLVVIAALLCFTLASPAHALVKAGSKCSKLNATSTVSGKKYTCIKSGAKLVWNKGVIVKKSTTLKAGVCPQASALDASSGITLGRANTLIGMKEIDAESCAAQLEWGYRVVSREGEDYSTTLDYRFDRVSVIIKKGLISGVDVG
jgi:hypothetical protein